RWPRDLVSVEVQDRQHCAVADRVQELHALPRALERTRFRLAVSDDSDCNEGGIVEDGAKGVNQDISQLAALVNRPRSRNAHVARDATRRRELPEETTDALCVLRNLRIDLRIASFEIHIGDDGRAAVSRAGDIDDVRVALPDDAVQGRIDEAR